MTDPNQTTRYPIVRDVMGYEVKMRPTGEVRWLGPVLQQAWVPERGGHVIWHDVQIVNPEDAQ